MAVLLDTTDPNCVAYCSDNAWQQTLKLSLPTTDIVTFEAATAGTEAIECGYRILNATVNATGNQTPVDFGAPSSLGGVVYVFVQEITGTATNASIKVQSSTSSGGTYADEATVTFSEVGGYSAVMPTGVSGFLRVNVASLGGATAIKLAVIACVKGVTY